MTKKDNTPEAVKTSEGTEAAKEAAVTLNGRGVYACGIKAITRRGNLATEQCGYGIALVIDNQSASRQKYEMLAQLLKGCKDIAIGKAYEEYTKDAMEEGRALAMLAKFSEITGIPMLEREAKRVEELKTKAEEMKKKAEAEAEAKKDEKEEEKKTRKTKTGVERVTEVINKLDASERVGALLGVLDTLNKEAAGAARLVIAGVTAEEAARTIIKAREEAEAARKRTEQAARG